MQDYKDSEAYKAIEDFIISELHKHKDDDFDDKDAEISWNDTLWKIFQYAKNNCWLVEGIDYDEVFAIDDTEYENGYFIKEGDDESYGCTEEVLYDLAQKIYFDEIKADPRLVALFTFYDQSFSRIVHGEEEEDDDDTTD